MEYYDKDDRSEAISDFQRLLRGIGFYTGDDKLKVATDGSYDEATEDAVRYFQEKYGLPVTGTVDNETYKRVRAIFLEYVEILEEPLSIKPFPQSRKGNLRRGERSDLVFILQLMLNNMKLYFDIIATIPLNGIFDENTENAVKQYQKIAGLDVTGEVDRRTWNRMARDYNDAVYENQ